MRGLCAWCGRRVLPLIKLNVFIRKRSSEGQGLQVGEEERESCISRSGSPGHS